MDDENERGYYKIGVAVVSALLVAAIGQGVVVWRDNSVLSSSVEDIQRAVDAIALTQRNLAEQSHANTIHRLEHEKQAARWIDKILENERDIHAMQQRNFRPDPFTGAQGRDLDRRLKALEEQ